MGRALNPGINSPVDSRRRVETESAREVAVGGHITPAVVG